jgi:hypothetical protein
MKTKIYCQLIWIGLFIMPSLSFSQNNSSQEKINGYCDHVVVTIPGIYFDSLIKQLKTALPSSIALMPDNSKAFLIPEKPLPYVELWNSSTSLYTGSQVAFGSEEENASVQAQNYYGFKGVAYAELLTVGRENSSGHPYGGNFFVTYGKMNISNPNDSLEVSRLKEVRTLIPDTKSFVADDYSFFGFDIEKETDAFTATDVNETVIKAKWVDSTPEAVLGGGIGHVSLHFELTKEIYAERKEVKVGGFMNLIFDGKTFTLILLSSQYEKW